MKTNSENAGERVSEERSYQVVKSNEFIQKSRFNLSMYEQKIVLYIISKIKPEDKELREQEFRIVDFCRLCGLDDENGKNYQNLKVVLKAIHDKSMWLKDSTGSETLLSWFDSVTLSPGTGSLTLRINESMSPHLLNLKQKFTKFELLFTLAMKSQYSIRLYEILKSYEYLGHKKFDLDMLKEQLCAEKYIYFSNFDEKVLKIAVREINEVSDIKVSYTPIREGKKYKFIDVDISLKKDYNQRIDTLDSIRAIIGT